MLFKIFISTIVLLEMINIPNAEKKVEQFSVSVFNKPLSISEESSNSIKKNEFANINIEKIAPWPMIKKNIKNPYMPAEGAMVIDVSSSKILYQKGGDKTFSMASLTKMMTAIISIENYNFKDIVTVPEEAPFVLGSKINLRSNEKITVESLLYGLLLYSGNDSATTLASKIGQDKFVLKMNEKAKELDLNSIHYYDSTGLDERNTGTLKDLAILAAYALRNEKFAKFVSTNEITISSVDGTIQHPLKNSNKLLRDYTGTFGVKTGYTEEAGHCLISAVEHSGHKVITVMLNHPSDQFKESMKLLDWVFNAYRW
ncbi:MAG: hypothetical protein NT135_02220 [Candidatus Berkelbacteria bacterium]|nr:hypothetical protein [Candidatus Berkelbacteria bacterium]